MPFPLTLGVLTAHSLVLNNSSGDIAVAAIALADDPASNGAHGELISENGLNGDVRSESYPVKYITLAGIAMSRVGESPRQRLAVPSYLAIFTSPSQVPVKLRRDVSSIAQASAKAVDVEFEGEAMQNSALFGFQNTSRQQAVTPVSVGRRAQVDWNCGGTSLCARRDVSGIFVGVVGAVDVPEGCVGWDCSRTRTTSRGVTIGRNVNLDTVRGIKFNWLT